MFHTEHFLLVRPIIASNGVPYLQKTSVREGEERGKRKGWLLGDREAILFPYSLIEYGNSRCRDCTAVGDKFVACSAVAVNQNISRHDSEV